MSQLQRVSEETYDEVISHPQPKEKFDVDDNMCYGSSKDAETISGKRKIKGIKVLFAFLSCSSLLL